MYEGYYSRGFDWVTAHLRNQGADAVRKDPKCVLQRQKPTSRAYGNPVLVLRWEEAGIEL